jgi:hypothetical protein
LIEHDDVVVRFFLQTLIGPTYEWYISLLAQSIGSFDDLESMFMTMYAPPIAYHTILTQITQIHLKKGEIIEDFNFRFFKTLNQIPESQRPNNLVIFKCYKIAMPSNVNYAIRASQINDLNETIQKETKMEEYMLETYVDPEIILGKVQRQMTSMSISTQGPSTSINSEN